MKNSRVKNIRIVGMIPSYAFQRAKYFVLELHRSMPLRFPAPEIEGLLEMEWHERVTEWRHIYGPEIWRLKRPVAVFLNDKFIGNDTDLLKLTSLENVFVASIPMKDSCFMKRRLMEDYLDRLKSSKLIHCYFDICVDDNFIGTLVFQLYSNIVPKTCENFTNLCLGSKGNFLSYKGSTIHRIVKNGWLQGGDLSYVTEGGRLRIYPTPFEDECFGILHDRRGVLSMVNHGRHTNGTQFLITLNATRWMDTRYVAFGQLIQGVKVLNILESIETRGEQPMKKIEIKNCGKLNLQDVDDVDLRYAPDMSDAAVKRPKKIETIAEQVSRLVMEAVTECLAIKENVPDVVHEGDTPSGINLDLYFQGMYSLPEEVLEDTARYIRNLRRDLLRSLKPSATEIVEVIAYDLVEAVFVKLVDLDDVREAATHPVYQKLIDGIDMKVEKAEKPHVRKFVDQLVATCENMLKVISSKLNWMRRNSLKIRTFQEQMNDWIESFTLQETFADDNYRIVDRPEYVPPRKKHPCDLHDEETPPRNATVEEEEEVDECDAKNLEAENKMENMTPMGICCCEKISVIEPRLSNYFRTCIYGLKRREKDVEDKIPILELIERCRYRLRIIRHQEERLRSKARICLEKRIRKWMKEVVYIPETEWIRQTVFAEEDICLDHTQEILYGAMTIGLLEMYYLMEKYLKIPKVKKYLTRIIYPEDENESLVDVTELERRQERDVQGESPCSSSESDSFAEDGAGEGNESGAGKSMKGSKKSPGKKGKAHKPCTCGDICCDCTSEPGHSGNVKEDGNEFDNEDDNEYDNKNYNKDGPSLANGGKLIPPTPPPSLNASETSKDGERTGMTDGSSCSQDTEEFLVEDILARVTGESPDNVNVKSFKWLQKYILSEGCELKSNFAAQVHSFLEGEIFSCQGFLSKHSLVTKASFLSFSLSLADLLKEKNDLKSEIKNFIRDLWELYFNEMFKEALLEHPPEEGGSAAEAGDEDKEPKAQDAVEGTDAADEPAFKMDFDFDKFCKEHEEANEEVGEEIAAEPNEVGNEREEEGTEPKVPEPQAPETNPEQKKTQPAETEKILLAEDDEEHKVEPRKEPEREAEALAPPIPKKRKSPIVIKELVESSIEVREGFPYSLPFWVKFLTEITKRTLGLIAKLSRLPRRLYFNSDSQISFDDKMKSWIDFNRFSSPTTGGGDIRDFIAQHHVSIENLDATARSFLRKKVASALIDKSSRSNSAMSVAEELVVELLVGAMEKTDSGEAGRKRILDEVFEGLVGSATVSATETHESDGSDREEATTTDVRDTKTSEGD